MENKDEEKNKYCETLWGPGIPYGVVFRCERATKHQMPHRCYHSESGDVIIEWEGKPTAEELKGLDEALAGVERAAAAAHIMREKESQRT